MNPLDMTTEQLIDEVVRLRAAARPPVQAGEDKGTGDNQ